MKVLCPKWVACVFALLSVTINTQTILPLRLIALHQAEISSPQTSGILEFEREGSWYRFCDEDWTASNAYVACGQLGFSNAIISSESQRRPYRHDTRIRIKNVACDGTESWITQCSHQNTDTNNMCDSGHPAILSCFTSSSVSQRDIRLKGGAHAGEGRVEILPENRWGSICGHMWNRNSANVACRQLGYGTARESYTTPQFGQGQGAIWITNTNCRGNEQSLTACSFNRIPPQVYYGDYTGPSCSQSQLAGVVCFIPDEGHRSKIALLDGRDASYGRVVVRLSENGATGSVCSDNWTIREASVVCRQMGLGYAFAALQDAFYWTGSGRNLETVMVNVRCRGNESALDECEHEFNTRNFFVNCGSRLRFSSAYVGVSCVDALPDLQIAAQRLEDSFYLELLPLHALECAASENCLSPSAYEIADQTATRSLLRFTVGVWNRGTADFFPWQRSEEWEYHECHQHYHSMEQFSHYDILWNATSESVAEGHKVSFCLADTLCSQGYSPKYNCTEESVGLEQGISVGCADIYYNTYDCQWIDITDVAPGNYVIRITLNPLELVAETDFSNNVILCSMQYNGINISVDNCYIPDDYVL